VISSVFFCLAPQPVAIQLLTPRKKINKNNKKSLAIAREWCNVLVGKEHAAG
jgi:hypothetical protein